MDKDIFNVKKYVIFRLQGFKNIDVYGIDLIGNFSTIVGARINGNREY